MKDLVSLAIVLLLGLLQSTILGINFLLVFILWRQRYYWAFLTGLIYDLMAHQRLGLSSLVFLFILLLFRLYLRKFEPRALFLVIFIFLAGYLFAQIEGQIWHFWQGVALAVSILLLRKSFRREVQLRLDL